MFNSPYIETEHLLLGLLREAKAIAQSLGPDSFESIRNQLKMPTMFNKVVSHSLDLLLSDECKRVWLTLARKQSSYRTGSSEQSICCSDCCGKRNAYVPTCSSREVCP